MGLSDTSLYESWKRTRDADAFTELVTRHSSMVFNACLRVLGNASVAEEVAQDSFVALMKTSYPINVSVGGWLHSVATRRALDNLKTEKRRKEREDRYAKQTPLHAEPQWEDVKAYADEAILELPERLRTPIVLRFLDGRTHREIARETGVSRSTVKRRIQQGIETVRSTLEKKGISTGVLLASMLGAIPSQAVPPSLIGELGKMAMAGTSAVGLTAPSAALAHSGAGIGGLIVMKKVSLAICVIAIAVGSVVTIMRVDRSKTDPTSLDQEETTTLSRANEDSEGQQAPQPETIADETGGVPQESDPEVSDPSTPAQEPEATLPPTSPETKNHIGNAGKGDLVIFGTVVNQANNPIQDVSIRSTGHGADLSVQTEEAGAFRLEGLTDGLYRLDVRHDVHTPQRLAGIAPGEEPVLIVLEGTAVLEGTVIAASTGASIPAFEIASVAGRLGKLDRASLAQLRAFQEPQGQFRLENVNLGESTVVARAQGYKLAFVPLILDQAETYTGVQIALQPGLVIQGTVFDKKGQPVPNALVFSGPPPQPAALASFTRHGSPTIHIDAVSDTQGRYQIDTFRPEDLIVSAYSPQFGQGESSVAPNRTGPTTVDIILSSHTTGAIEGVVTVGGKPAGASNVWAGPVGGEGITLQSTRTGQDGQFALQDLRPGPLSVFATFPGQTSGSVRRFMGDAEVFAGQTTQLDIDFEEPSATLEGRVTLAGDPPIGGNIVLRIVGERGTEMYFGDFGQRGDFLFEDVVPGTGNIHINANFAQTERSKNIDVELAENAEEYMEIDLAGGLAVSGIMTGLQGTENAFVAALRGAHAIENLTEDNLMSLEPFLAGRGNVAMSGDFAIEGLEAGAYTILAIVTRSTGPREFEDMRWAATSIEIADEEALVSVDFDMTVD